MKHVIHSNGDVVLLPDSVPESGLLAWLAERYEGQSVTLMFGTWTNPFCVIGCVDMIPGILIRKEKGE